MKPTVAVVLATYNRKTLLSECLDALAHQTRKPETIIIIDNASTDGTQNYLTEQIKKTDNNIIYHRQAENTGGSGAYFEGVKIAQDIGSEWIWMMDDDGCPDSTALESMLMSITSNLDVYGSSAYYFENEEKRLCFNAMNSENSHELFKYIKDLPSTLPVTGLPFIGFMVSSSLVSKIGLPDKDFFISLDDLEYAERAKKFGSKIWLIRDSQIRHPIPGSQYDFNFFGKIFHCGSLAPWRRYYDVRNRIIISKRYWGTQLWTKTLPSLLVRIFAALLYEDQQLGQLKAFLLGLYDGLRGVSGKRVEPGQKF